jgi:hypothetical protein
MVAVSVLWVGLLGLVPAVLYVSRRYSNPSLGLLCVCVLSFLVVVGYIGLLGVLL